MSVTELHPVMRWVRIATLQTMCVGRRRERFEVAKSMGTGGELEGLSEHNQATGASIIFNEPSPRLAANMSPVALDGAERCFRA